MYILHSSNDNKSKKNIDYKEVLVVIKTNALVNNFNL